MIYFVLFLIPVIFTDGCIIHAPSPSIEQLDGNFVMLNWTRRNEEEKFIIKYWPKKYPQNVQSFPIFDGGKTLVKVKLERGVTYSFRLSINIEGKSLHQYGS